MPDRPSVADFGFPAHSHAAESAVPARIVLGRLVSPPLVRIAKLVVFTTVFAGRSEMQGRIAV
jgi:hypothetical protein